MSLLVAAPYAAPGRRPARTLLVNASPGGPSANRTAAAGGALRRHREDRAGWARFVALAEQSRSLPELLAAVAGRPLTSRLVTNRVLLAAGPRPPLLLEAGEHPLRLIEHVIVDPAHPAAAPIGISSAHLVTARLPAEIRGPARRGEDTLSALLDWAGSYWTADTLHVEKLTPGTARRELNLAPDLPALRLTRALHLLGTPVALVVDEAHGPARDTWPP